MPFEILDGVAFYETGYTRKGRFKPYHEGGTITLFLESVTRHTALLPTRKQRPNSAQGLAGTTPTILTGVKSL